MEYGGKESFPFMSDSAVVLNQIGCLPYMFKPWVGARIQEIRENVDSEVAFMISPTSNNHADILTRAYYGPPSTLPWAAYSISVV